MEWLMLCGVFLLLLFLGVPVALVMAMTAALGVVTISGFDAVVVVQQLFAGLNTYTSLAVPFFIISGSIAAGGGTSKSLIKVMQIAVGRFRGGMAIATIMACAFFAAITGTTMATIVAIGSIMIPALLEAGYPKRFVLGLVAAGGTLGILIPPSVPMVNLSVAMSASVSRQFTAGFVPGVLLALIWCVYAVVFSRKNNIEDRCTFTREEVIDTLKKGTPAVMYPVIVLGSIYGGWATPTEAAVISIVYVVAIELLYYKSIKPMEILKMAGNGAVTAGGLLMLVAGSKVISWYVAANQVPAAVAEFISSNISSKYVFVTILVICFCVLGCFLDIIPLSYILGPILANTLTAYGIEFAQFGIICITCVQVGNLTPPFGMCLFVTMGVAKEPLPEVSRGAMPFIITLALFALLCAYVPGISMWLPKLLGR